MIQFNLLPDVKLDFIKARRTKQMVLVVASLAAVCSLIILVLLVLVVDVLQKKHLSDVNKDIKTDTSQLNGIPNLTKILTVQNQLKSLPTLDNQKPVTSRLFGYLGQVMPSQVILTSLNVDFVQHTMVFTGTADSLDRINTFVDTLKFTNYSPAGQTNNSNPAFTNVVLTGFSHSSTTSSSFTINTNFAPAIFDSSQAVSHLSVPANKITTRSETELPNSALFNSSTSSSNATSP